MIIGEISELIARAGRVDNIPAINIHSPCLRVVLSPKYSFDVDHQANTGVENPIIHAFLFSQPRVIQPGSTYITVAIVQFTCPRDHASSQLRWSQDFLVAQGPFQNV